MSEWRPGDWKNPYSGVEFADWAESLWEAGADAIVAALIQGGVYGQYTAGIDEGPWIVGDDGTYFDIADVVSDENKKGYLVFIPDKE